MVAPVNDNFADRTELFFAGSVTVGPVSNVEATKEAIEDTMWGTGFSSSLYRTMWWGYRPDPATTVDYTSTATVTLPTGQNMRCVVMVNRSGVDEWSNHTTEAYTYDGGEVLFYPESGMTYAIAVAAPADADMDYSFVLAGPDGVPPPEPSIELQATLAPSQAAFSIEADVVEEPEPGFLLVLTPALDQAPTTARVALSNLQPNQEVTFTIDGIEVATDVADSNGDIGTVDLPVDERFLMGVHTITATTSTEVLAGDFSLAQDPISFPVNPDPDAPPEQPELAVSKWVLQDPGGLGTWVMPINPTSMGAPHVRKTVAATSTTAVFGRPHVSEGATPVEWEFAGYCPDQAFADQLIAFSELQRRFYLIDHRGRAWTVAFQSVDLKPRKRSRDDNGVDRDDRADYTVRAVLFSQTPKEPA